jgi:hypothetical protein
LPCATTTPHQIFMSPFLCVVVACSLPCIVVRHSLPCVVIVQSLPCVIIIYLLRCYICPPPFYAMCRF